MEYIDIITRAGQKTGQSKPRKHIHRDGDWHRVIDICIVNPNGEVLIQRRSKTKESFPDLWDTSCAGHIEAGAESLETAIRELEEELGLTIDSKSLEYLFTIEDPHITNNGTYIDNELKDQYLLEMDLDPQNLNLQDEEVQDAKLVHFQTLEKALKERPHRFVSHDQQYKKLFSILQTRYN